MLKPGHRLGNYELEGVIGDGGMAVVYRAKHIAMGTDHALKVLLDNLALNPRTVERFRQEARAQFRLRHANIVQVTDYVEQDGAIALVMDLVQGMNLRAAMDLRPGPWPVADVVAVMKPVLEAMAHAHRHGLDGAAVVHRDLKPENILLDLGQGIAWPGIPKVADFGIAKVMGAANLGTRTNARMGTVPYMSPEQFRSARDVDARADVWALGVMLWHLLAGRLPIDPDDNVQLLQLYQGLLPIPALAAVVPGVPRALSDAVAQALSLDPVGRFEDAWPLLRAVEGAAGAGRPERPVPVVSVVDVPVAQTVKIGNLTWQFATAPEAYTWDGAKVYCAGLKLEGGGWRLPTKEELESLIDKSRSAAPYVVDPLVAPTRSSWYWSGSSVEGSSSRAWRVDFGYGGSHINDIEYNNRVRCVR